MIGMFAPGQIAHAAQLGGMFFGLAVGLYYRKELGERITRRKVKPIPEKHMRTWEDRWF